MADGLGSRQGSNTCQSAIRPDRRCGCLILEPPASAVAERSQGSGWRDSRARVASSACDALGQQMLSTMVGMAPQLGLSSFWPEIGCLVPMATGY